MSQGKDKSTFEDRVQKLLTEMFGEDAVTYQPKLKYISVTVDGSKAVINLKSFEGMRVFLIVSLFCIINLLCKIESSTF